MKIRNRETGDVLEARRPQIIGNAIRVEFVSENEYEMWYIYPTDTLEELVEDGGYEMLEEE